MQAALQDSTKLIQLEQEINSQVGQNANYELLVDLSQVFTSADPADQQIKFLASLVLKNTVKNYASQLVTAQGSDASQRIA